MSRDYDHIPVKPETRKILEELKDKGETWDEFVKRILAGQGYDVDVKAPKKEIYEDETEAWIDILEAVRDIKPPSKFKEMLIWFLFGMGGGFGLGLFLGLR